MRCSMSLATACHPASRNPATTGTQESVCSLCGQLHIFSPPCKKKKGKKVATKVRPPSHSLSNHRIDEGQSQRLRGWPPGWTGKHVGVTHLLAPRRLGGKRRGLQQQHWRLIVLSLQEEGKPRTNLTWFPPQGDCSPIQGCHSHATH